MSRNRIDRTGSRIAATRRRIAGRYCVSPMVGMSEPLQSTAGGTVTESLNRSSTSAYVSASSTAASY